MTITITESEARAIFLALSRGAKLDGEDIIGLLLKTSGTRLLKEGELTALVDKLECNLLGLSGGDYPRYEVIIEGSTHYLPLRQAASWYDCGWTKVEIGEWVLTEPVKVPDDSAKVRRPLSAADRDQIREAADQHSEGK